MQPSHEELSRGAALQSNVSKISSTLPPGAMVIPNLEAYSRNMVAEKNQKSQMSAISAFQDKWNIKEQFKQKKRIAVWKKALTESLGLKNLEGLSLSQIYQKFPLLQQNSIQQIKAGKFKL